MSEKVLVDVDKFMASVAPYLGTWSERILRERLIDSASNSPPPTPNLDLLRRFAKVAGWVELQYDHTDDFHFAKDPGDKGGFVVTMVHVHCDDAASKWLDSPEALDAAAIVAVRKGGGLEWRFSLGGGCICHVMDKGATMSTFPAAIGWASADYAGRAAVLACLKAFEEKS